MKNASKTLAIILAAALLAATLAGCGSDGETQESDTPESGEVWVPAFGSLPEELGYFDCTALSGETIFVASTGVIRQSYDQSSFLGQNTTSTVESYSDAEPALYRVSQDGKSCEKLPDFAPMALPEGSEGSISINGLCVDLQGNIWVCESTYAYHYDLPEGFSGSDEQKAEYYVDDGEKYAVRKLSPTGAELLNIDISDLAEDADYFSVSGFVCDSAGNIYFSDGQTTLYVYDGNGVQLFTLAVQSWISALITLSDGSVAVGSYGQTDFEVIPVDTAAKSWGSPMALNYPDQIYSGKGDYAFFYTLASALYGYNKETGQSERLFGWLDCDLDQDNIRTLAMRDDGSLLCVCSGDDGGEVVTLSKQAASTVTQKTELTLATMGLDSILRKQILKFNKTSDTCRIVVKDYSEYSTADDYNAGITKMSTEIIAGNVPDIISISRMPVGQYVSRGLLEDLYPYIDSDEELSRDSFVPSILKAMEINGGLYQASSGFGIFTVIGRTDTVGADMGWTLDEMMACLAEQPEGTELFQLGLTKADMLQYVCYMYMNDFVDWQTGTCRFDSTDFIKLLEFCAGFDDTFNYTEETYESEVSRIQSGKQLLEITTESDFNSFQMYEAMFGGDIVYKGFPRENGVGNVAYIDTGLAMTTACKDKEGAWSFIRTLLTEEYQTGGNQWNFPINQAAFDKNLSEAMEKEMYTDENGNEVESSKGGWGWDGFFVDMYAVTEEQAARIKSLVDSVDSVLIFDTSIYGIISDESAAYFAGSKSAEETAKLIQSRVAIYVSEQG